MLDSVHRSHSPSNDFHRPAAARHRSNYERAYGPATTSSQRSTDTGSQYRRRRRRSSPFLFAAPNSNLFARFQTDEYHRHVVEFLRQPNFESLLNERLPSMVQDERLRKKLACIAKQGLTALYRLSNDVDVITVLRWYPLYSRRDSYIPASTVTFQPV